MKRSDKSQDRGVDRSEKVDPSHRPVGVERDCHRGRGGGKERVGHGEHDLSAVTVTKRGPHRGEQGGRGELEERDQTQGRGTAHFVGVDEDRDEVRHLGHAEAEVGSEHPPHVPDTKRLDEETMEAAMSTPTPLRRSHRPVLDTKESYIPGWCPLGRGLLRPGHRQGSRVTVAPTRSTSSGGRVQRSSASPVAPSNRDRCR